MTVNGYWWKLMGVLLIVYSLIAGMLVPLGPGVARLSPMNGKAGQSITLNITGYNVHYNNGHNDVWLKLDDMHVLEASSITVMDRRHLAATFNLPSSYPGKDTINVFSLIVYNEVDGHSVLPSALFVNGNDIESDSEKWESEVKLAGAPVGVHFPYRNILKETIRNTFFHVQLWMAMMFILLASAWHSVAYLRSRQQSSDLKAFTLASTGLLLGLLGIVTGMIWAKNTWGRYWSFDVKQNMAAIAMLIYFAYFILRSSITDPDVAKRFSAVYNVFAFLMLIPLLYIIPRMTSSLHPGSGGNPAFGSEDLDNTMRMVFYPAILGWILFGLWISQVHFKYLRLKEKVDR